MPAYNKQVKHSTGITPFSLELAKHPPGLKTVDHPSALPKDAKHTTASFIFKESLVYQIHVMRTN